jgi:hypothetical protein
MPVGYPPAPRPTPGSVPALGESGSGKSVSSLAILALPPHPAGRRRSRAGMTCRTVFSARAAACSAGAGGGGDPECDGQSDGLLVVEQQRGQLRAGVEPVPTVGPLTCDLHQ